MKERCELCRFWRDGEPGVPPEAEEISPLAPGLTHLVKLGYCLRYPPIANPTEGKVGVPVTNFDDWCGEFSARIDDHPGPGVR